MDYEFRFLEFEGIMVAAFIEGRTQNEHSGYYASNVLFYVRQGTLNIRVKNRLYAITKGNFCIVRKLTEASYFKTWDESEDCAIVDAMILHDDVIKSVIKELGYKTPTKRLPDAVVNLDDNAILRGLYSSLTLYLTDNQVTDKNLLYLKTKEALLGILQSNPDYLALFYEFSKPVKAELDLFMEHHSYLNKPLSELAKLSGRSLSTFNRDFRKLYKTSPHKWILKKRLHRAREILISTSKKSSEIYLELGFKDLGHFSRTFKKEFNMSPSEISRN